MPTTVTVNSLAQINLSARRPGDPQTEDGEAEEVPLIDQLGRPIESDEENGTKVWNSSL